MVRDRTGFRRVRTVDHVLFIIRLIRLQVLFPSENQIKRIVNQRLIFDLNWLVSTRLISGQRRSWLLLLFDLSADYSRLQEYTNSSTRNRAETMIPTRLRTMTVLNINDMIIMFEFGSVLFIFLYEHGRLSVILTMSAQRKKRRTGASTNTTSKSRKPTGGV